jgi:hypothetical protein
MNNEGCRKCLFVYALVFLLHQLDLVGRRISACGSRGYIPASVAFCPYHRINEETFPASRIKLLRIAHILQNFSFPLSNIEIETLQFFRYQSCPALFLNPLLFLSLMTLRSFPLALTLSSSLPKMDIFLPSCPSADFPQLSMR